MLPTFKSPYPSPFRGTAVEIDNYHLVMVDLDFVRQAVQRETEEGTIQSRFLMYPDDSFQLAEWCANEVIARAFTMIPVANHTHVDKYCHFFDETLEGHQLRFKDLLRSYVDFETKIRVLKLLFLGHRSILAIGM